MSDRLQRAQAAAEKLVAEQVVPGLEVLVQEGDQAPRGFCLGADASGKQITPDTLFPVASLSKMATALLVLRLAAEHDLALDDPLGLYLPEAQAAGAAVQPPVTIRALLCHTGGMPDELSDETAPYTPALSWAVIADASLRTPPILPAGTRLVYSNPGYALLGVAVERLTGKPFAQALYEWVLAPLGIEAYLGDEPPRLPAVIAGDLGRHAGTELEPFNSRFWRSLAMPYGSLVTTAYGALRLARTFLGITPGFLPDALLAEARSDQTGGLPGSMAGMFAWEQAPWGLGVELRGVKNPHAIAPQASPDSFGHLGSSGASAWVDPAHDVAWVMLGARAFSEWWQRMPEVSAAILETVDL